MTASDHDDDDRDTGCPASLPWPMTVKDGGKIQHGPSPGNHQEQAADRDHHAQRDDERIHLQLGDEKTVHQAHRQGRHEGQRDGEDRRGAGGQRQAADHAREGEGGADGEIQAARDQKDDHADGDGALHREPEEDGLEIRPGEENGRRGRHDDAADHEHENEDGFAERENGTDAPAQEMRSGCPECCSWCSAFLPIGPTAVRWHTTESAPPRNPALATSPTILPWCMTRIRSHSPISSGRSEEIRTTPIPPPASSSILA